MSGLISYFWGNTTDEVPEEAYRRIQQLPMSHLSYYPVVVSKELMAYFKKTEIKVQPYSPTHSVDTFFFKTSATTPIERVQALAEAFKNTLPVVYWTDIQIDERAPAEFYSIYLPMALKNKFNTDFVIQHGKVIWDSTLAISKIDVDKLISQKRTTFPNLVLPLSFFKSKNSKSVETVSDGLFDEKSFTSKISFSIEPSPISKFVLSKFEKCVEREMRNNLVWPQDERISKGNFEKGDKQVVFFTINEKSKKFFLEKYDALVRQILESVVNTTLTTKDAIECCKRFNLKTSKRVAAVRLAKSQEGCAVKMMYCVPENRKFYLEMFAAIEKDLKQVQ
ncbi:hypothetical protein EIN_398750 [Entamoeba invadens IP1]|uniref:Uncharacterized protein n=1 Tax=Entamoeba invadens IP1 TaxID=370355 RepID=A0A0A1UA97_ENTIV|nr:hypothetical protein EIN_398750 [Entamoeba invadens IP1]ELP91905.1 hypothetical protein EIN_398750 [Entamoeba invadens IP1]|eukprot:XP_004258676.1 hypothetical protein EIN_398750 [Entamoeba invadens IP1]